MSRTIQRTRTTRRPRVSRLGAALVVLASLVQPAWSLAPAHARGSEGADCCCTSADAASPASVASVTSAGPSGCCEKPAGDPAPASPASTDCDCRILPADESPVPATPAAADVTRELIRRHHHAAGFSLQSLTGTQGVGAGAASAMRRAHDPPGVRTAPARSLGERDVARWLAFLSVARI